MGAKTARQARQLSLDERASREGKWSWWMVSLRQEGGTRGTLTSDTLRLSGTD